MKNQHRSDTRCWETETTNAEQESTPCDGEPVYAKIKRDIHRERERERVWHKTEYTVFSIATTTRQITTTLTKGYKVTLYSD